jgi:hypothetical protein
MSNEPDEHQASEEQPARCGTYWLAEQLGAAELARALDQGVPVERDGVIFLEEPKP